MNALDLREGWDINKKEDRDRLLEYVREKQPAFVIGSPPCKMFSKLQDMSAWTRKKRQQYDDVVSATGARREIFHT